MSIYDKIIIYPTDTVWGIGASIFNKNLNDQVLKIKKSSLRKPSSVLFQGVEQFEGFFKFPSEKLKLKLVGLFDLETTVLIPVEWLKKEIPKFVYMNSDKVGVRIAKPMLAEKLKEVCLDPITTTSLNLTGDSPIVEEVRAVTFQGEHFPGAYLISLPESISSGRPSSILSIDKSFSLSWVRKGRYALKLEKLLEILPT